ncbi:MAG: hypothetical protein K0S45_2418 [Nitrospira sp.]|jgi:hypothetical protein|nr:hypothetical protein [Nitrospira sp.]
MAPRRIGISILSAFALVALIGCNGHSSNRQLPPPPGASVHQSPSHAAPTAPQGSMSAPATTPEPPGHPSAP